MALRTSFFKGIFFKIFFPLAKILFFLQMGLQKYYNFLTLYSLEAFNHKSFKGWVYITNKYIENVITTGVRATDVEF